MSSHKQPLVKLENVSFSVKEKSIVRHIDLSILPEQIITCIGPNGSGKTTLARLILGLEKPSHGIISKAELCVGYMPQKLHIDPTLPLPVETFLMLGLKSRRQMNNAYCQAMLERLNIKKLCKQSMHALSGGEFQRVLLARALMRKPNLLVLDEPVQGVDVNGQVEIYQLITQIQAELKCAIFMISHDLHIVMSSTHDVICLNHHICCQGHPDLVKKNPEFLALFGDEAAKYLAFYTHDTAHDHTHLHNGK